MWPFNIRFVDHGTFGAALKSPHLSAMLQSATFFCSSFMETILLQIYEIQYKNTFCNYQILFASTLSFAIKSSSSFLSAAVSGSSLGAIFCYQCDHKPN